MNTDDFPIEARECDIELIGDEKYTQPLIPARPRKPVKDFSLLGFDTEYHPTEHRLLSVQLAAYGADGELRSKAFKWDKPRITASGLLNLCLDFVRSIGLEPDRSMFLISHFSQSEIGMIENWLDEFRIKVYSKAMGGEMVEDGEGMREVAARAEAGGRRLKIIDLFAYFPTSLKQIGEMVGLEKFEVDRERIDELAKSDWAGFSRYAARDAEIALKAFTRLRSDVLSQYGVDVLRSPTMPSVAGSIFRTRFLKRPACPVRLRADLRTVKVKSGYSERVRRRLVYGGPLDPRHLALRCYWGGRNEAYVRGLFDGNYRLYDAVSLYPSASMLQPLPNDSTRWELFDRMEDGINLEGLCRCEFEFPPDQLYPSLPVKEEWHKKLYFPSEGVSYCTISEIRIACELGAEIKSIRGFVFEPTDAERDHDLSKFVKHFLGLKSESPEGSLGYETNKLIINSLIGKFVQRSDAEFEAAQTLKRGFGLSLEQLSGALKDHRIRRILKHPQTVGSVWSPEWAALITGRGRALMGELVALGAMFCSTDSALLPASALVDCDAVAQLKSVGSDFRPTPLDGDERIDRALMFSTRRYALMRDGKVVDCARHGCAVSKEDFARLVLEYLEVGRDLGIKISKKHLVGPREAIREFKELGSDEDREALIRFDWDGKRELEKPDVDVFRESTGTRPLREAPAIEAGRERARRGRPKSDVRIEVLDAMRCGEPIEEICTKFGISRRTAYRIRRLLGRAVP